VRRDGDLRRQQMMERGGAAVTCDGRLFHRRAAATGNALSPTVDRRVRRTSRDVDEVHAGLSIARRLAVARPKLSGRRSSSTVLSQVCLGLPVLLSPVFGRTPNAGPESSGVVLTGVGMAQMTKEGQVPVKKRIQTSR